MDALAPQWYRSARLPADLDRIDLDPEFRALFFRALDAEIQRCTAERLDELEALADAVGGAAETLQSLIHPPSGERAA
ncbi:hypothetical protein [Streptomyces formicae]|uniref:Hpt domain-containing protein n=1 Tax=Streptomyces formicae TaxID=1616117 RepID=A0ABY3WH26_9ACTN|nr:hypothetical protein [Streptomyces formicae]UNM10687.1 hypothetical protein J4032_03445 [Streptomyces formicae]